MATPEASVSMVKIFEKYGKEKTGTDVILFVSFVKASVTAVDHENSVERNKSVRGATSVAY